HFKAIIGDGGAMGGKDSQEFMAITADRTDLEKWLVLGNSIESIDEIPNTVIEQIKEELSKWLVAGEDTVVYAEGGDYAANLEMATNKFENIASYTETLELEKVATPNVKTIDEVAEFLEADVAETLKTLVFRADGELIVVLMHGNDELNEVKLQNYLGANVIEPATETDVESLSGAHFGSLGPIGLKGVKIIADREVEVVKNAIIGANEDGFHYRNANLGRDFEVDEFVDLRVVNEGEISPDGRGTLKFARGIEIGHIFKLGTRYSDSMGANILDQNGKAVPIVMGCYGIGVSRMLSAILEQFARIYVEKTPREEYKFSWSINFPKELAPFDIHLVPVNTKDEEAMAVTAELETALRGKGYQVLVDDRNERAGVKFADSDLIGLPVRVTIGKKASEGIVEVKIRATGEVVEINKEELVNTIEILTK
ncbi:MAG TPA: proline--tRNA ligase, partial [Lactococcus sp.]|nr:proline--tRNA ligase [Lactococcus sp.]